MSDTRIQIVREIRNIVERWNAVSGIIIPPLVHIAVGLQESNLDPTAIGDSGKSPGIFQIYQIAHPNTDQLAQSPWSDYGYFIIRAPWEKAWSQLGGDSAWQTLADRPLFLEQFAPLAQGSIAWPSGTGYVRYQEAVALWELAG